MKSNSIPLCERSALSAWLAVAVMATSFAAQAATITVNSVADDVFINAAGQTFSDAAYTVPAAPAYCTLRMAISSANRDAATGGCAAGSGADSINFSVPANSTITIAQVAMDPAPVPFVPSPLWLLFSTGNVVINGPGSALLTINGGGLGAAASGLRTLFFSNNDGLVDAPATITGVSFKEGRNVGGSGGCIFSRESLTLTDVRFESCEAVGNAASTVGGGALAMNVTGTTDARPNATLSNVKFIGNRAVHGANASSSCCGAASFGHGTAFMGSVTIADSQFIGNVGESVGALRIQNGGSATFTNTQFISNTATTGNNGGFQISAMTGTVTMNRSGAVANVALGRRGGGSITTIGSAIALGDVVTISDSSFIGNAAGADIGGLDILTDTFDVSGNCQYAQLKDVRLTNVYFEKNIGSSSRGGFRIGCSGNVAMTGVEMTFNEVGGLPTPGSGGNSAGQLFDVATVTMDNIRIIGNKTYGGVITPPATSNGGFGVFTIIGPPFATPSLTYPLAHSFAGSRFLVKDNFATENEAGVSLRPNGAGRNYSLSDSTFVGNRAKGIVGLFLNATGNYTVTNSTFSGNIATAGAGPLFLNTHSNSGTNSFVLRGITSARNGPNAFAMQIGYFSPTGGATAPNATVTVSNAILGQFTFGNGIPPVLTDVLPNVTYAFANSVIENGAGLLAGTCGANGVICNVDAKLEGLADNGGSVQTYTHALRPGSPALDAGSNAGAPAFDQRGSGFPRIVNGTVDIGAFESPVLAATLPCKLDMDGDNQVRANKEGLVLLRAMLGVIGSAVVSGTGITQAQWDSARNNLNANCGTSFAP